MAERWRLVCSPPARGSVNMALDQAILESVAAGHAPPTLRLYAWEPPCLSLGHAQALSDVDLERLAERQWEWVRRPTGGKAILHTDELTYAVALPARHPLAAGSVLETYRSLSRGLTAALARLGVFTQLHPTPPAPGDRLNPVCFEVPSAYEVTFQGKKLIGSAQVRRGGGVLQHGSLPLRGDITRICDALRYPDEASRRQAAARLAARATTLEVCLGRAVGWQEVASALAAGFADALGLEWTQEDCSPQEIERAREIAAALAARPNGILPQSSGRRGRGRNATLRGGEDHI